MNLNEYQWHDAVLKEIRIDRSDPGNRDVIDIVIIWQDSVENTFSFINVYYARLDLNFGVIADEAISDARYMKPDDKDVIAFIQKWEKLEPSIDSLFFRNNYKLHR